MGPQVAIKMIDRNNAAFDLAALRKEVPFVFCIPLEPRLLHQSRRIQKRKPWIRARKDRIDCGGTREGALERIDRNDAACDLAALCSEVDACRLTLEG